METALGSQFLTLSKNRNRGFEDIVDVEESSKKKQTPLLTMDISSQLKWSKTKASESLAQLHDFMGDAPSSSF